MIGRIIREPQGNRFPIRHALSLILAGMLMEGCVGAPPRPISTPIPRDQNPCYVIGRDDPSCADPFLAQYMNEVGGITSKALRAELVGRAISVPNANDMVSIVIDEEMVRMRSAPSLTATELPRQKGSVLVVDNPLLVRAASTNPSERKSDYWIYAHTDQHPDQDGVGRVFFSAFSPDTIAFMRLIRSGMETNLGGEVSVDGYIAQYGLYGNEWTVETVTNEEGHMLTKAVKPGTPRTELFPRRAQRVAKNNPLGYQTSFLRIAMASGSSIVAAQEHNMMIGNAITSLSQ